MPHGSVQYHLNTIISNERPFLGCYSFKKMKFGVILGQKEGIYRPHMCSLFYELGMCHYTIPLRELLGQKGGFMSIMSLLPLRG